MSEQEYRLVPFPPTDTMIACGKGAINEMSGPHVHSRHVEACYNAMLNVWSTAPVPVTDLGEWPFA